jgi:hypothetical protein
LSKPDNYTEDNYTYPPLSPSQVFFAYTYYFQFNADFSFYPDNEAAGYFLWGILKKICSKQCTVAHESSDISCNFYDEDENTFEEDGVQFYMSHECHEIVTKVQFVNLIKEVISQYEYLQRNRWQRKPIIASKEREVIQEIKSLMQTNFCD